VQRLDEERAMRELLEHMRGIRGDEQDVLTLCDWSGLSISEAASALGIPEGTVKSRLSRARAHLRELIQEPDSTPLRNEEAKPQ
jgi:RNA polymerase sigma-70 factor (ECF subfamily)